MIVLVFFLSPTIAEAAFVSNVRNECCSCLIKGVSGFFLGGESGWDFFEGWGVGVGWGFFFFFFFIFKEHLDSSVEQVVTCIFYIKHAV